MADRSTLVRTLSAALSGQTDVQLALLFGSEARGTAGPGSDVDVAVLAPGVDVLALVSSLSQAVGREVDVVRIEGASVPLLGQLVRDSVVVHEGVRAAAAAWRTRALLALEIDGPWYARMRDAWLARVAERGL